MDKASKINVDSVSIIISIVSVTFLEHKKHSWIHLALSSVSSSQDWMLSKSVKIGSLFSYLPSDFPAARKAGISGTHG